jgi:hypothetical protein
MSPRYAVDSVGSRTVESISTSLLIIDMALASLPVVGYAVAAVVLPTRWQLDRDGITLRAASLWFQPVRIAWHDLNWIRFGSGIVGHVALKLDGRYLFARHVTLHRHGGLTRLVRCTPSDIPRMEREVAAWLAPDPRWQRTRWGWLREGCQGPPGEA